LMHMPKLRPATHNKSGVEQLVRYRAAFMNP
jgi:hypothetical protein